MSDFVCSACSGTGLVGHLQSIGMTCPVCFGTGDTEAGERKRERRERMEDQREAAADARWRDREA